MSSNQLTPIQKKTLRDEAEQHISSLKKDLNYKSERLIEMAQKHRELIPELNDIGIDDAASDDAMKEMAIAKIQLFEGMAKDLEVIKDSPYFVRMDIVWKESKEKETLYFGKGLYKEGNIYSWVSPISTLRYEGVGPAFYETPKGEKRHVTIERQDNFLITGGEVVFMTHEDEVYPRQMVFQKHMNERQEFLLPEIVAELDRLQDQIIRSDPAGHFLISGPAGSGKTTLALHRVAYLVLTPEFKGYFEPERILVFVSNESDISYFGKLLPELGISGVKVTTFGLYATLVASSRFTKATKDRFRLMRKEQALEFIAANNPYPNVHPRIILDEFRKIKQQFIETLEIPEGRHKLVHQTLHKWYQGNTEQLDPRMAKAFNKFLKFQKQENILDEVDLVILLKSVENPLKQYTHVVVDEVQNWLPEQLDVVTSLATRNYKSVTFIGDIRQKTKAYAIKSWEEINEEFAKQGPRSVELVKVYRNSEPILKHLSEKGYNVSTESRLEGGKVDKSKGESEEEIVVRVKEILKNYEGKQVGILSKHRDDLERLEYLGHGDEFVHVLAIEEAQGLEFEAVILIKPEVLEEDFSELKELIGDVSVREYAEQNRHLYYVAVTRAKRDLWLVG